MADPHLDEETLRLLADEGNETALERLAELINARNDHHALSELFDEGSEHAGRLLTLRAIEKRDLHELQRLADAGSSEAEAKLEQILRDGTQS